MKLSDFTGVHIKNFWKYVKISTVRGGCWEWQGSTRNDYGVLSIKGGKESAHRISFFIHNGFLPTGGRIVCHRCHNKPCIRPDHLYEGTQSENQLDRGELERLQGTAKKKKYTKKDLDKVRTRRVRLDATKAEEVRQIYALGKHSQRQIAVMFNCSQNTISNVLSGISWK